MQKPSGDQPDRTTDLSEAARAAVRDAGDPRIDAHLAALGLLPDAALPAVPVAPADADEAPAEPAEVPELGLLRARVGELEVALAAARRQVRWLAAALVVALAGLVMAIGVLLSRPG